MGEPVRLSPEISPELRAVLDRGMSQVPSEEEVARWHTNRERQDREDRLAASGILERLDERGARAILTDVAEPTRAIELVRPWLVSSRPVLVLLSVQPGLGKTVAAAWALSRVPGRYVRAEDLCEMRELGLAKTAEGARERDRWYAHARAELLVVDELGLEKSPVQAQSNLQSLIDMRQRSPRRTLLLGNLSKTDLVERYDARTLDRLGVESDEAGIAILRSLSGPSLRAGAR